METQYIGARYVPKFYENSANPNSMEWESGRGYEALTVVTLNDDTYTSKKPVPSGIGNPANNPQYWAKTGNFNAALEGLQEEISSIKNGGVNDNSIEYSKLTEDAIKKIKSGSKIIFMPNTEVLDPTAANGACAVFVSNIGKIVMYDSGTSGDYEAIKEELNKNSIEHIDYFVLSHYHGDHFSNIPSLMNDGFINVDTIAYLPRNTSAVEGWDIIQQTVREYFSSNTVVTISSNAPLKVDNFEFDFFNCNANDFSYYEAQGYTNGNTYSVCSYVKSEEFSILMSGDLNIDAARHLLPTKIFKPCNVLNVPHHGILANADMLNVFLDAAPQCAVVNAGAAGEYTHDNYLNTNNHYGVSNKTAFLNTMDVPTYLTGYGAVYIGVDNDCYSVVGSDKTVNSYYTQVETFTLYVNDTYVGIPTGSSDRPFNNITQALAYINNCKNSYIFKIVIIGEYLHQDETIEFGDISHYIQLIGGINDGNYAVKLKAVNCKHCNCYLEKINLKNTESAALNVTLNSFVTMNECCIDGDTTDANNNYSKAGVAVDGNSFVFMSRGSISNRNVAFYTTNGGNIYYDNVTGSGNNYLISGSNGGEIMGSSDSIGNTTAITQRYNSVPPCNAIKIGNSIKCYSSNSPFIVDASGVAGTVNVDLSARIYNDKIFRIMCTNGAVYQCYKRSGNIENLVSVQSATDSSDNTFAVTANGSTLTITHSSMVKVIAY